MTDAEVTDHLARAWSRERRKEAAADYMTPGMKAVVFGARRTEPVHDAPGWVAANDSGDGVLSDLALRIRYGEIAIRHGATVEGLGKACRGLNKSLAAWDRKRASEGSAAVAMDPGFRADLRAAGAVLRAARPYLRGDPLHRRLLAERGGIAAADLEELAARRRRGRSIRDRSVGERRKADPGFVPAPPARRPEDARIAAIGRDLEALQPAEPSIEVSAARAKPKLRQEPSPAEIRPTAVSAREAEALYDRLLADAAANRAAARRHGIHPYETEEGPGLIERGRALLRLQALPAARARVLRNTVAAYDRWFTSQQRSPKPAPAPPKRRQTPSQAETRPAALSAAEAVTLHRRFLAAAIMNRRAAHSRGLHPYQTEEAPALIEQARALLRLEALPAARARALRDDVARYDDWFRSGRRAPKPAPGSEQPRRPRRESRAQVEFDAFYDRFLADARANRAAARRQGVHPYMTGDAPRIIRRARELVRTGRLPSLAADTLSKTIVEYERMRAQAAQTQRRAPAPPTDAVKPKRKRRVAPPAQSRPTRETPPERASPADTVRKASTAAPTPAPTPKPPAAEPAPAQAQKPAPQPRPPQGPDPVIQEAIAELEQVFANIRARSTRQPTDPEPTPSTAPPEPRELSTDLSTEDLLRELRQLRDANLELAQDSNVDPCATEQWPSIYRAARELGHRKDVPDDAWPFLHGIISAHHRWESQQRPRQDPPAQSIRIRY